MDHSDVRMMLSSDELTIEVEGHLGSCRACRLWRDRLERVRALAPETASPPVPPALLERVMSAVRDVPSEVVAPPLAAGAGPGSVALDRAARRTGRIEGAARQSWWRRAGGRAAIAAAVLTAIGLVAVTRNGSNDRAILVASAAKTEAAQTARLEYAGSIRATFTLTRLPPIPPLPNFPDIVPTLFPLPLVPEGIPEESRRAFESAIDEARRRVQESLEQARQSARETQSRAREAYRDSIERLTHPMTVEMRFEGTGEIVFPDRLHLKGTVRTVAPVPFPEEGTFELIQVGDDAWIRLPLTGGRWVRIPSVDSPVRVTLQPDRVLDAMREVADVRSLGRQRVGGEPVDRFRSTASAGVAPGGSVRRSHTDTIDVLIASDDLLRRAELTGRGELRTPFVTSTYESSERFELSDFGSDVTVNAPGARDVVDTPTLFSFGVFQLGLGNGGLGFSIDFTPPSLPELAEVPELRDLPGFPGS